MPVRGLRDPYRDEREAIRRRVCAICLDGTDDASCGLAGARCPIEELLPHLVEAVRDPQLRRDPGFAAAVEARVCRHCRERDAFGLCRSRREGRCAVAVFLPLIVEAIDDAASGPSAA